MTEGRRITVYRSLDDQKEQRGGRVVLVCDSLVDTLKAVSTKLGIIVNELRFVNGGVADDITLIRDNDVFIAERISDTLQTSPVPPSSPYHLNGLPGDELLSIPPSLLQRQDTPPQQQQDTPPQQQDSIADPTSFTLRKCSIVLASDSPSRHDWVRLNIGGRVFATTRATIVSDSNSMLARMFESEWFSATDDTGAYLIDRSPDYFEPLLNFLRHGKLILNEGVNPQGVLEEAKFFNITKAVEILESLVQKKELSHDGHMTRKEFVQMISSTSSSSVLRCQGINLEGVDLSNLDLRNINFKCANLQYCNLSHSDLTNCNLERADLTGATLEGAILQCVYMPRVIMEGACLKGCSMDERLEVSSNLEGANLKAATFDNSQMNGVNLRLASLKGASLRSCNLRYAVMAGTDLENCDLRGSNLQYANLRGANVAGVNFDDMIAPLHMSQTVNVQGVSQSQFNATDNNHLNDSIS